MALLAPGGNMLAVTRYFAPLGPQPWPLVRPPLFLLLQHGGAFLGGGGEEGGGCAQGPLWCTKKGQQHVLGGPEHVGDAWGLSMGTRSTAVWDSVPMTSLRGTAAAFLVGVALHVWPLSLGSGSQNSLLDPGPAATWGTCASLLTMHPTMIFFPSFISKIWVHGQVKGGSWAHFFDSERHHGTCSGPFWTRKKGPENFGVVALVEPPLEQKQAKKGQREKAEKEQERRME